ncbi:antitoxin Xre/MbcA/ParS toxin-binding domain-containing protein [Legionella spiritensis]|uniref:Antitoxin Xre/MbcA/ParS-like toxin-binding domain-containing protein n=1 Tax=Legionella spiritensis TaxID=452 RepID=A0A0W0Z5U4_LEGSP|nr:antitoxin Xre/MbcA/ParS toxin-binding domain-containing protein [Legionella spiritensis]KTD64493.1 hypothetical protein Lspi_1300 [Legionella spiritensis]SNV45546.1 Uncharacterized conserved protein [Legionella spiritensis]VEG90963.1 Uncharacterized conserved protein [Legionella spiritensis]
MANITIKELLGDPIKEIETIRSGVLPQHIEDYLSPYEYVMKDVLQRLDIPSSTYKSKKGRKQVLDSAASEKLMRLVSVIKVAGEIIGESETKDWLYREIPSLGNRKPIDLLDTEVGHRLVEQALQQIKYGVYS